MRKAVITLAVCFALAGSAVAQQVDTVHWYTPPVEYFVNSWPDHYNFVDVNTSRVRAYPGYKDQAATSFVTYDTLKVYGVAACVMTVEFFNQYREAAGRPLIELNVLDTSHVSPFEYLRLFQYHDGNMQQKGNDLYVQIPTTPVSYMLDMGVEQNAMDRPLIPLPIRELFFDEPQTVVDTFFLGITGFNVKPDTIINGETWQREWYLYLYDFLPRDEKTGGACCEHSRIYAFLNSSYVMDSVPTWMFQPISEPFYTLIFPIVTPEGLRGNRGGGETPVVRMSDMVEQYTELTPNPASGKVRVMSSFELRGIEVIDMSGEVVLRDEVSGHSVILNIGGLSSGVYVVRVATAAGVCTKKMVVR